MRSHFRISPLPWLLLAATLAAAPLPAQAQRSARSARSASAAKPASTTHFASIDAILEQAVAEQQPPGAVVIIGHNGRVVYRKPFGWRSLEPTRERMTVDTIFDLASLTKCLATATAVMQLVQEGQVRINDPVARYLPEFAVNGKDQITVRQLLTHFSGLPEDLALKPSWQGKATALRMAMEATPIYPSGSRFLYSDINYEVLGALVERVSGMPLDQYALQHIFQPLHMTRTRFNPPASWRAKIAPTEYDEHGVMLRGVVHDPTARRMGGVAGHAGVFSTADDVARFAQAMLHGGGGVLSPLTVEKMTTPQQPPNATVLQGLGWDIDSPFSSNRGELLPVGSFGHTGFTGTSLWIDPVTDTYIIILANGVHPRGGKGKSLVSLRSRVATAVTAALNLTVNEKGKLRLARITGYNETLSAARRIPVRNGQVRLGIDVLEARNFDVLRKPDGSKAAVGLITNQTGLDSRGQRTIDVLAHAPGIELKVIFAPEHGALGAEDTAHIAESKDAATGIPIFVTYGPGGFRAPPRELLRGLDAVVYDIQDAGARFFTYETTAQYFLEPAAQARVRVVILDRPNPITGSFVQGPITDPGRESFVNAQPVPVRHGMTVGELAQMYNAERKVAAKLTVVPMEGWVRGDWFDSTGLVWINPSPNLRSLTEATLYPGVALIEGTNVSVGRGTDTPFEVVGAPWIRPKEFADYLNARLIPGVRFVPVMFTPMALGPTPALQFPSKYNNQLCGGVNIILLDRNTLDAPELGIELAAALRKLYPEEYKMDRMMELLANQETLDAIAAGVDPRRIAAEWREPLERFEQLRKQYLLY
jgi:uncharacterized protein YbbC (DUF1343 family)/CubicO group peptidase (beta-lactamase class C family)